jgi:hypothetical protein
MSDTKEACLTRLYEARNAINEKTDYDTLHLALRAVDWAEKYRSTFTPEEERVRYYVSVIANDRLFVAIQGA